MFPKPTDASSDASSDAWPFPRFDSRARAVCVGAGCWVLGCGLRVVVVGVPQFQPTSHHFLVSGTEFSTLDTPEMRTRFMLAGAELGCTLQV